MSGCPTDDDAPPRPACQAWIRDEHRHGTWSRAALWVIGLLVLAAFVTGIMRTVNRVDRTVTHLAALDKRTTPFAPLKAYPPAVILDRVPGVAGAAIATPPGGETLLHVAATICNRTQAKVVVRSSLSWVPYDSGGHQRFGSEFTLYAGVPQDRPPGCNAFTAKHPFVTPVPVTVATVNRVLGPGTVWRLLLSDTPVKADGEVGVRVDSVSLPFRLIPTD